MHPDDLSLFDPSSEITIVDRRLPHWQQPGVICFITWRTHDSMPEAVIKRWQQEREAWLVQAGLTANQARAKDAEKSLPLNKRHLFKSYIAQRWMDSLDACHGACELRQPPLARIVADSLSHFDGDRYLLTDFVVMPNHVHLLVAFPDEEAMMRQCESWKHYTATKINRILARSGRFWQQDAFDHLLRSEVQFRYLREYIARNPSKARLQAGEFIHYSRAGV
jgi:putative transposase